MLWGGAVALLVADYATTRVGLEKGLQEANPILAWSIHHGGVDTILAAKLVVLLSGLLLYMITDEWGKSLIPATIIIVMALVLSINVLAL